MPSITNYSVDMIKKASFVDELNNILRVLPSDKLDEAKTAVIQYLESRIAEIDKRYKKK